MVILFVFLRRKNELFLVSEVKMEGIFLVVIWRRVMWKRWKEKYMGSEILEIYEIRNGGNIWDQKWWKLLNGKLVWRKWR